MNSFVAHDLKTNCADRIKEIRQECGDAAWAGYFFFGGPEAEKLDRAKAEGGVAEYEKRPRAPKNPTAEGRLGLHITSWHSKNLPLDSVSDSDFLYMFSPTKPITVRVTGYANDGTKQAIRVEYSSDDKKPPIFLQKPEITPHISVSWAKGQNPADCGTMIFLDKIPDGIPTELKDGQFIVVTKDGSEMNVDVPRAMIRALEQERSKQIEEKLKKIIGDEMVDKLKDEKTQEQALHDLYPSKANETTPEVFATAVLFMFYCKDLAETDIQQNKELQDAQPDKDDEPQPKDSQDEESQDEDTIGDD